MSFILFLTETPEKEILWAAENGDANRVSELLEANSNLTKVSDKDGYTPLHRAAYNNHLRVVDVNKFKNLFFKQNLLCLLPILFLCRYYLLMVLI